MTRASHRAATLRPASLRHATQRSICPVCFGELVVGAPTHRGDEGGTRYWWCPYCDAPQDPAGADEAQA
jgi:formate dehydrogenase maturation protein FdhE